MKCVAQEFFPQPAIRFSNALRKMTTPHWRSSLKPGAAGVHLQRQQCLLLCSISCCIWKSLSFHENPSSKSHWHKKSSDLQRERPLYILLIPLLALLKNPCLIRKKWKITLLLLPRKQYYNKPTIAWWIIFLDSMTSFSLMFWLRYYVSWIAVQISKNCSLRKSGLCAVCIFRFKLTMRQHHLWGEDCCYQIRRYCLCLCSASIGDRTVAPLVFVWRPDWVFLAISVCSRDRTFSFPSWLQILFPLSSDSLTPLRYHI